MSDINEVNRSMYDIVVRVDQYLHIHDITDVSI